MNFEKEFRKEEKFRIEIKEGHYYARIFVNQNGVEVWCAVGAVDQVKTENLSSMARMARFYYLGKILHNLTTPIFRCTKDKAIDMVGKKDGKLMICKDGKTTEPFNEEEYNKTIEHESEDLWTKQSSKSVT